jgi:hypothetical protein
VKSAEDLPGAAADTSAVRLSAAATSVIDLCPATSIFLSNPKIGEEF